VAYVQTRTGKALRKDRHGDGPLKCR
jgi:hypothetical protein